MTIDFSGDVYFWKGPAPFYFVRIPQEESDQLRDVMRSVTYGWGMILVKAKVGATEWSTALWPKDGQYILPLKAMVRRAEQIEEGDTIEARLEVLDASPVR